MKAISSILLLVFSFLLQGQLPDSIELQLVDKGSYKEKVNYLDEIRKESFRSNSALFLSVAKRGMELADENEDDSTFLYFKSYTGTYFTYRNEFDSARKVFYDILNEDDLDIRFKANVLLEIGITYYYEGNLSKALEFFIQTYEISRDTKDIKRLAGITNNIGTINNYLEDYHLAIEYFNKALFYKYQIDDSSTLGTTYHNLGIAHESLQDSDSALYYFELSRQIKKKYNDIRGLSNTYISLGATYLHLEKLDSAEKYARKGVAIDRKLNDRAALYWDMLNLAEILTKKNEFTEAKVLAREVYEGTSDVIVMRNTTELLATINDRIGNDRKANSYRKELVSLMDSIFKTEKEESLQELKVEFETEQKEAEIKQLTAENQIKDLQTKQDAQTRLILIIVLAALLIIALLFYSRFRNKTKTNALLDAKNQELSNLNKTKDSLFSIISHDLKSPLSSFHLITKSLTDNLDSLDKSQLKEYLESLRDSSANVRDMMDNLLKWALTQTDQLGSKAEEVELNSILNGVVSQLDVVSSAKSIAIQKNLKEDVKLLGDASFLEIIIRNLLSNSLKFTEAGKSVFIETDEQSDKTIIRLRDEGVGMDQEEIDKLLSGEILGSEIQNSTEKGTGLGITLVKELVKKMDGRLSVQSEKGRGTTFELTFSKAA